MGPGRRPLLRCFQHPAKAEGQDALRAPRTAGSHAPKRPRFVARRRKPLEPRPSHTHSPERATAPTSTTNANSSPSIRIAIRAPYVRATTFHHRSSHDRNPTPKVTVRWTPRAKSIVGPSAQAPARGATSIEETPPKADHATPFPSRSVHAARSHTNDAHSLRRLAPSISPHGPEGKPRRARIARGAARQAPGSQPPFPIAWQGERKQNRRLRSARHERLPASSAPHVPPSVTRQARFGAASTICTRLDLSCHHGGRAV